MTIEFGLVDALVLDYQEKNVEVRNYFLQIIQSKCELQKTSKVRKRKKLDNFQVENLVLDYLRRRGFDEIYEDLKIALEKRGSHKFPDSSSTPLCDDRVYSYLISNPEYYEVAKILSKPEIPSVNSKAKIVLRNLIEVIRLIIRFVELNTRTAVLLIQVTFIYRSIIKHKIVEKKLYQLKDVTLLISL